MLVGSVWRSNLAIGSQLARILFDTVTARQARFMMGGRE
jgi:hypothetical protein